MKKNNIAAVPNTQIVKENVVNCRQDFKMLISATNANPNGDPNAASARPRTDLNGYGLVTGICIKHKIRQQLVAMGEKIMIQTAQLATDGFTAIKDRIEACEGYKNASLKEQGEIIKDNFIDARAFGFLAPKKGSNSGSVNGYGAITIGIGKSVSPVNVSIIGITKCANNEGNDKMGSDRCGEKAVVDFGLYEITGSVNPYFSAINGLTWDDLEKIKEAMIHMLENTGSEARPQGSIRIEHFYWWDHRNSGEGKGMYPSAPAWAVHDSVVVKSKLGKDEIPTSMDDYTIEVKKLRNITAPVDLAYQKDFE